MSASGRWYATTPILMLYSAVTGIHTQQEWLRPVATMCRPRNPDGGAESMQPAQQSRDGCGTWAETETRTASSIISITAGCRRVAAEPYTLQVKACNDINIVWLRKTYISAAASSNYSECNTPHTGSPTDKITEVSKFGILIFRRYPFSTSVATFLIVSDKSW